MAQEPHFTADARVLGAKLDLVGLPGGQLVGRGPNTYEIGKGKYVAAFRYGVVVFFGLTSEEAGEWTERLQAYVESPFEERERDVLEVRFDPVGREGLDENGALTLREPSVERLQVVAHVLAKSTVLVHFEQLVTEEFGRAEASVQLIDPRSGRRRSRELLDDIRRALSIQAQAVGRAETTEKPEILWDAPGLDRLYELLESEFELHERDAALTRKLSFITDSATTSLGLIHTRQSLRVEWYIVILILVEIVLIVYDIARY